MNSAVTIFISGITGVAAGMAVLYFAVKLTAVVVDRLGASGKK